MTVEPRDACPHPYSQCEHPSLKHSQVAARCSTVRHGAGTLSIRTATAHLDCFNGTTTCPVRSMNGDRRIRCSAIGLPKCTGIRTAPRDGRHCISSGITVPSTLALNRPFCAKALRCRSGNGPFRPFATGVSTKQAKLPQKQPISNCVDKQLMHTPGPNGGAHNCFTGSPHAFFKSLRLRTTPFLVRGVSRRNSGRYHPQL